MSGAATTLVFGTSPAASEPQAELWTTFTVRVEDASGNLVGTWSDPITLYERPVNRFVASFIGSSPMNFIPGRLARRNGQLFFEERACRVKVDDGMMDPLKAYESKPIVFGIRPEDIYDKLFVQYAPPENTVTVTVEVVEPMGAEVFLHLLVGPHAITARVGGHERPRAGQDVEVVFDMSKVHFFDPETEEAIV